MIPLRRDTGRALGVVIVILLIIAVIGALLPPFFTDGRCTREFDARTQSVENLRAELATADRARAYLAAHALPFAEISSEECRHSPPRGVEYCGDGPILLTRVQTDMQPFRILSAPMLGLEFYWAR
ncbi:MAG TPA: hypothetical protein VE046_13605 [Steroidobacteraceae bacterium]|nr:hypothetical protein [Steroidobacteraceae bacterium]